MPASLLTPRWNELGLKLFPNWILEKVSGGEDFETRVTGQGKRQKRNSPLADGWQRVSLAGGNLEGDDEMSAWTAFRRAIKGAFKSFLFKNRFHYRLDNAHFATGDGATTSFQLKLATSYQPSDDDDVQEVVIRYVDHRYPPMIFPVDGSVYEDTKTLRIFVDGVEMPWLQGWDVDRNTGIVTFDVAPHAGAILTAIGEFFCRMRFATDWAPAETDDGSSFVIPSGVELIEVEN